MIDGMTIHDAKRLTAALKQAGFAEVNVHRDEKKHWLRMTAKKA